MKIKRKFIILTFVLFGMSGFAPAVSAQCPMCKAGVESSMKAKGEHKSGYGLNSGIIMLLVMPYAVFGAVGFFWYRSSSRRKLNKA